MPHLMTPLPGSTILFEGDSLTGFRLKPGLDTWAWQRLTNAAEGYPERVGNWIFCQRPDLKLTVRLGAVGGSTMADVLARWPITEELKPGIVVMTIGTNDATRQIPPATLRDQVATYCQRLRALCGGRVLYLGNLHATTDNSPATTQRRIAAAGHYAAVAEAVSSEGGAVADLGSVLARRSAALKALWDGHTIYHDGTHFNAVGNEIVAGVVLQALGLMTIPGEP